MSICYKLMNVGNLFWINNLSNYCINEIIANNGI